LGKTNSISTIPDHNICIPDCSVTSSTNNWYTSGWSSGDIATAEYRGWVNNLYAETGYHWAATYGSWATPAGGDKIYSIDGVCVEKCPYAGENMYPDAGYTAQIDYFGAAVAADSASEWLRTASTATNPEQALNYINKGECIPICLEMEGTKYYA